MLTRSQLRKAIYRYARRYGFFAHTVRVCTSLRFEAIQEYEREVLGAGLSSTSFKA